MTLDELMKIKNVLDDCRPSVEDFSWGPSLEMAQDRRDLARKIVRREIRRLKIEENERTH